MDFGLRLKELREAKGLSQQALANSAGMHVFGVAKLEQGLRQPSWATACALADALGIPINEFRIPASRTEHAPPGRPPGDKEAPKPKARRKGK